MLHLPYLYHLFARGRATSKHGGGGRYNAILKFKGRKMRKIKKEQQFEYEKKRRKEEKNI
jgi:hypothetical protein